MSRSPNPSTSRFFAVVPAAGVGARLGAAIPKQYLAIGDRSVLAWSLAPLLAAPWIHGVLVVVAPGDERATEACEPLCAAHGDRLRIRAVGGASRRDSVLAGLDALAVDAAERPIDSDWVLVHDAARPGLTGASLDRMREELGDDPVGGILALPVADTVKQADPEGRVINTVPREGLWLAQTPQMFRFGVLREALRRHPGVTDEAAAIEACGMPVRLVEGERRNFKVTTAADLALMVELLRTTRPPGTVTGASRSLKG